MERIILVDAATEWQSFVNDHVTSVYHLLVSHNHGLKYHVGMSDFSLSLSLCLSWDWLRLWLRR